MGNYLYNALYRPLTSPSIIGVIIFCLLLIASSSEYMVNDEGIWNYIAFLWIKYGIPPYIGAIENKSPGIFMIFVISNLLFDVNIWFPRILGSLVMVATSIVLYLIGRRLYDDLAGIIAMVIFGLSVTWKFMDGTYTAQTESFMVLFSTLAFFFLLDSHKARGTSLHITGIFIAGLFMGIAISFKQTAIFSAVALFAFLLSFENNQFSSNYKNILINSFFLMAGILFPICLTLILLLVSGITIADYSKEVWLVLLQKGGGAELDITSRIWTFITKWRYSEMILFYPLVLLFIIQRKRIRDNNIPFWGIIFWLSLDFLGVNASGFYFGHQFKQVMPSLAIASGIAISMLFQTPLIVETERRRYIVQAIVLIAILWAPYQTLYRFYSINIKGGVEDEYGQYRELGLWIKENTKDNDYIYLLGAHTNPAQAYSERRSASRYFSSLFMGRDGAKQEIIDDLTQNKPKFIIIEHRMSGSIKRVLPELEVILKQSYQRKMTQYDLEIYERNSLKN